MTTKVKKHYTVDREPEGEEWDECPGCGGVLDFIGEDPYVDEYEIYAYFECRNDCRTQDVVVRYQGGADGALGDSVVRSRGTKPGPKKNA